jgi:hypothetical protein
MTISRWTAPTWALAAVVVALAWALADPGASSVLGELTGSGGGLAALLWGCGVCFGAGLMAVAVPVPVLLATLMVGANLAKITACVGICWGAFSV